MEESSSSSAVLAIGGVSLRVSSELELVDSFDGPYGSFSRTPAGLPEPYSAIEVTVLAEPPAENTSTVLFDSDGAWEMQSDPDGYRLSFHREGSRVAHTVVCSDASTTRVRVHVLDDGPVAAAPDPGGQEVVFSPVRYPVDQLLLMNHLASRGGVIVHAAAVLLGGIALVFAGRSGAGKSTIARLFMEAGLGGALLSDDRAILRAAEDRPVTAWGTPWPGEARAARNAAAPLAALLFLVQSTVDELKPLGAGEAARRLMPVVTCPWYDPDRLPGVLDTCSRIVQQTPSYDLCFRAHGDVVRLLTSRPWPVLE